jgi:16S rRNA (guanine966-N2)-methyltransferase
MPDRVKEAVFNILGVHYGCPGALPPLRVADLFAGSGSLGLEALSRGAACCFFCERDPVALDALRRNLDTLQVNCEATIVAADAWRCDTASTDGKPVDLVFLDPPYRDSQDTTENGAVSRYLTRLSELEGEQPLVVLHHSAAIQYGTSRTGSWRIVDRRTIGSNATTFFAR